MADSCRTMKFRESTLSVFNEIATAGGWRGAAPNSWRGFYDFEGQFGDELMTKELERRDVRKLRDDLTVSTYKAFCTAIEELAEITLRYTSFSDRKVAAGTEA